MDNDEAERERRRGRARQYYQAHKYEIRRRARLRNLQKKRSQRKELRISKEAKLLRELAQGIPEEVEQQILTLPIEVINEKTRKYYPKFQAEILVHQKRLRLARINPRLRERNELAPGIPEDVIRQMLTLNLENNEEKTSEETL